MNTRAIQNQKDAAIMDKNEFSRILSRARPPTIDRSADESKFVNQSKHEKLIHVTETWSNSIANQRKGRINRLHEEADQKEAELMKEFEEEKKYQKEMRKRALEEAEEIGLQEQPEIRAVNSQLLLHEVVKERKRQLEIKEQQKEREYERQRRYELEEARAIQEAKEAEEEAKRKRRQKAVATAEVFKQQRAELEERKMRERELEIEEEALLAAEAKRQLEAEKAKELQRREIERQKRYEVVSRNEELQSFKERERLLAEEEQRRIDREKAALIDEQEKRQAEEKRRREERQKHIDSLIEKQAEHLKTIKANQNDFEFKMEEKHFEKEKRSVVSIQEKTEKLREERRRDYLEAQRILEANRHKRKEKRPFPVSERSYTAENEVDYDSMKKNTFKEIADFQMKQAMEKKEMLAAQKERERLEFLHNLEEEEKKTREAQEYAREMLMSVRKRR